MGLITLGVAADTTPLPEGNQERWIMSYVNRTLILFVALYSTAALACDLDDCTLSDALHLESQAPIPADSWTWMNHDLAVARDALRSGEKSRAIALVRDLDRLMRTNLDAMTAVRGPERVRAMHAALQKISEQAGGWPLAELSGPLAGKQG